jgi:hypothetical protein
MWYVCPIKIMSGNMVFIPCHEVGPSLPQPCRLAYLRYCIVGRYLGTRYGTNSIGLQPRSSIEIWGSLGTVEHVLSRLDTVSDARRGFVRWQ